MVSPPSFTELTTRVGEVYAADGTILTENFLSVCSQVLPIIDQFGTGMIIVRSDIKGNIDRLTAAWSKDPEKFKNLFEIVLDEVARKQQDRSTSDTKGLLWLKRAMEFVTGLLGMLHDDREISVVNAAEGVYAVTLKPFHGFFTSTAFAVALKIAPSRATFMEKVGVTTEEKYAELETFLDAYKKVIADVDTFLVQHDLDDPTIV